MAHPHTQPVRATDALTELADRCEVQPVSEVLEEAREALEQWIAFAEANLGEFDVEECDSETLCPRCQNSGCITLKITETREAINNIRRAALQASSEETS